MPFRVRWLMVPPWSTDDWGGGGNQPQDRRTRHSATISRVSRARINIGPCSGGAGVGKRDVISVHRVIYAPATWWDACHWIYFRRNEERGKFCQPLPPPTKQLWRNGYGHLPSPCFAWKQVWSIHNRYYQKDLQQFFHDTGEILQESRYQLSKNFTDLEVRKTSLVMRLPPWRPKSWCWGFKFRLIK